MLKTRKAYLKQNHDRLELMDAEIDLPIIYRDVPHAELRAAVEEMARERAAVDHKDAPNFQMAVEGEFEMQPNDFFVHAPVLIVTTDGQTTRYNLVSGEKTVG